MNKIFGIIITVFVMITTVNIASANDFYVKRQLSQTTATGNVSVPGYNVSVSFDIEDTSGDNIGIGYDINHWLSVEASYDDLGRGVADKVSTKSVAFWTVANTNLTTIKGLPLKLTGRVGVASTTSKGTNNTFSDIGIVYGTGLALSVMSNMDVILDYTHREVNYSTSVSNIPLNINVNFNTIALGVKYKF